MRDLEALENLRGSKVEFIELDQDYLEAWKTAGREWAEKHSQDNAWVKRIADSYYGFLDRWEANIQMHLNQRR
jgi:TRAP-type mannitol/chloroaromatic compound transport system substrate-binding protein